MPNLCPNCGALRSEAGVCPRCLIGNALPSGVEITYSFQPDDPAKVLETLSKSVGPMPRVLLPDTAGSIDESPLIKPSSPEMPALAERTSRVQLLGEIARGGMGAVLKGRDADLGRDLAVKVLLETHRGNPDLIRRFVEEAQIGGQLQHPGIVPVYELGTFGDSRPYFTMKLVKGRTLADLLSSRKAPTDEQSRFLGIFEQIAQTVAYAHARGVIHRDLKPSNVMVGSFGEVQVMDWGLAKVLPKGGVVDDASAGKVEVQETVIATARSGDDTNLSQAGSIMGTPSYMAPEQARGEVERIDERADVFALGSILCEILTGQPAFTGRSSGEILRKAALGDLAAASAGVEASGADPELISLTKDCLAREPEDRPPDAGAVADRVAAYLAGVQARLRRAEIESVEERGRRRLTTVIAAAVLLLGMSGGGGYLWNQQQKAERLAKTARSVDDALADAARLRGEAQAAPAGDTARWSEALSATKRAEALLAQGEADASLKQRVHDLRTRIEKEQATAADKAHQLEADRVFLAELETIRGNRADQSDPKRTDTDYAAAFRKAGLDLDGAEPDQAARWLLSRSQPIELAIYLDDWAFVRRQADRPRADWNRLLAAARTADPDPWRNALRGRVDTGNEAAAEFRRLADDEKTLDLQPAPSLYLLARNLRFGISDTQRAERVMRRAVARFPGDFWSRVELAFFYEARGETEPGEVSASPDDPVRQMTAAVAIRPQSAMAHNFLGSALFYRGSLDEAVAEFREAIHCNSKYRSSYLGLGLALREQGKPIEAVTVYREAIQLDPDETLGHVGLGMALAELGRLDEAEFQCREGLRLKPGDPMVLIGLALVHRRQRKLDEAVGEFREILRLKPDWAMAHRVLGDCLRTQKKFDEAIAELREAIRLKPNVTYAHNALGLTFADQGKWDEAIAEYREAIRLRPDGLAHNNLGYALKAINRLDEAIAEYREAIRLNSHYANPHNGLGNVLSDQGKLDEAIAEYREAIRIDPEFAFAHTNLGHALRQKRDYAGAFAMFRKGHELGLKEPGWNRPSARWVEEAERLASLADRLPALLRGEDRPRDNPERLALGQLCYDSQRFVAASRFWAEALEADPKLGEVRQPQHRYNAACAAALAADGQGKDEPSIESEARARLRVQARNWLKAELLAWSKFLDSSRPQDRKTMIRAVLHWKKDTDLVSIRDPEALAKLPEAERKEWQALWAEVDALLERASTP